jgi:hypothetical protein
MLQDQGLYQEAATLMPKISEGVTKRNQEKEAQDMLFRRRQLVERLGGESMSAENAMAISESPDAFKEFVKNTWKAKSTQPPDRQQRYVNNEIVYEQWDPTQGKYVEIGRAPRSVAGQKPDLIQNLEYQANRIGCKLDDPECYKKAEEAYINLKRQDTASSQIIANTVNNLEEKQLPAARAAQKRAKRIKRGLKILGASGAKPITGAFAEARLSADKIASLFGLSKGAAASATEALATNQLGIAAQILASGAFGAGTGISERDLTSAMQMAGADMSLTVGGMVQILRSLHDAAVDEVIQHNSDINNLSDDALSRSAFKRSRYLVPVPERLPEPTPDEPTPDEPTPIKRPINELTQAELDREKEKSGIK